MVVGLLSDNNTYIVGPLKFLDYLAKALEIETVLIASGDFVALGDRASTTTVRDMDVYDLVAMACAANLNTGVVFDPHPEVNGMDTAIKRLEKKKVSHLRQWQR